MNPGVAAMREALIAVLRDAEKPLTTAEVITRAFADGGRTYAYYGRVYSNLRTLAKTGQVVWHSWNGACNRTFWEIGPEAPEPVAVDDLEQIWEASR